jgi:hypothetical protein
MSRLHSTLIALLVGAAATAGLSAAVHTVQLGQKAPAAQSVPASYLASRQAKLHAWSHSLHATLAKHPPALPKLPHFAPIATQQQPAQTAPVATAQQNVTYVKAPTVVKYKHAPAPPTATTTTTSWSDDGSGDDGGGDDGGGSGGGD